MRCLLLVAMLTAIGCSGQPAAKSVSPATTKKQTAAKKQPQPKPKKLTRKILLQSRDLGRKFLLFNQKFAGNFNYHSNFLTAEQSTEDGPVRQAGAFWGLALLHRDDPRPETEEAIRLGFDFFRRHSRKRENRRWIAYPGETVGQTGIVALVALGLIDYLQSKPKGDVELLQRSLAEYLNFLVSLRLKNGQFAPQFDLVTERPRGKPSPYFDGEALLALTKAAKYMNRADLRPLVVESALVMSDTYFRDKLNRDEASTKGFYQWGSMAFFELSETKWEGTDWCGTAVIAAAAWMIDVHRTLDRKRNTGYAYEGIVLAHEIARRHQNKKLTRRFADVIDQGMSRLVSWQVGGPTPNEYLNKHPTTDPQWVGGIMNAADDPWLRIDVTQHQMHATILALRWVYRPTRDRSIESKDNE